MINAAIPLTMDGGWRGPADVIAVGFYLAGVIPLMGISLLEIGITGRKKNEIGKLKEHTVYVGIFLVVAHIAMIFGMLSPNLLQITNMNM
jgi:L-cystine uptake protein TcyP (sodium:dicarboxylate symporter family)